MRVRSDTTERVLAVLMHLAKEGPSTIPALCAATKRGRLYTAFFVGEIYAFGLIAIMRMPGYRQITARLVNPGRRYLEAFDELDHRAPFAAYEPEPEE